MTKNKKKTNVVTKHWCLSKSSDKWPTVDSHFLNCVCNIFPLSKWRQKKRYCSSLTGSHNSIEWKMNKCECGFPWACLFLLYIFTDFIGVFFVYSHIPLFPISVTICISKRTPVLKWWQRLCISFHFPQSMSVCVCDRLRC